MKTSNYRPDIDGLRGLSILSVFIYHLDKTLIPGGFLGVDIFFVISGFLISKILISQLQENKFSFQVFYLNRARRLFPNLFLMLLITSCLFTFFLLPYELENFSRSVYFALTFISNIFFWTELNYFDSDSLKFPLLHTWSLGIEEQFYLFFPLFLFCFFRLKNLYLLIFILFLISLFLAEYFSFYGPQGNFYLIITRAWELLAGFISAFLQERRNRFFNSSIISNLSLVSIIGCFFIFDSGIRHPSLYTLLPIFCTIILLTTNNRRSASNVILKNKFLVFFGLISYSLYLWHYPIISFFNIYFIDVDFQLVFLSAILSLVFSYLTYKFFEKPLRDKNKIDNKKLVFILIFLIVPIISINFSVLINNGYVQKYDDFQKEIISLNSKERGKYVVSSFNEHLLTDEYFNIDSKRKVLLIGDSYAQDFSNIFINLVNLNELNFATFHISVECGNLYKTTFKTPKKCIYSNNQYSQSLEKAMSVSDVIILSSMWSNEVINHLQESIDNISNISTANLLIVNRKDFGDFDIRSLLKIKESELVGYRNKPKEEVIQINKKIKNLRNIEIINIFDIFCDQLKCAIFDENKKLLTHDGGHLTEAGVNYSLKGLSELSELVNVRSSLE